MVSPTLELQALVSQPMWVLGIKLGLSARAIRAWLSLRPSISRLLSGGGNTVWFKAQDHCGDGERVVVRKTESFFVPPFLL